MAQPTFEVKTEGLRDLRKALRKLDRDSDKELVRSLKAAMRPTLAIAQRMAPRSSGKLAVTGRAFVAGKQVGIRFTSPYAAVHHWGGTIAPRGTKFKIKRTEFALRAVASRVDEIVDELGDGFEDAARKNGWR